MQRPNGDDMFKGVIVVLLLAAFAVLALACRSCDGREGAAPKASAADLARIAEAYPAELLPVIHAARWDVQGRGKAWTLVAIVWAKNPAALAQLKGCPKREGATVVSFFDPATQTIYLCESRRGSDVDADLAHELAHAWMGYGASDEDEERCEAFARKVLAAVRNEQQGAGCRERFDL